MSHSYYIKSVLLRRLKVTLLNDTVLFHALTLNSYTSKQHLICKECFYLTLVSTLDYYNKKLPSTTAVYTQRQICQQMTISDYQMYKLLVLQYPLVEQLLSLRWDMPLIDTDQSLVMTMHHQYNRT